MNKLKILKISISSTALLSIVILIAMSFTLVVFPLSYYQSLAKVNFEDMVGYDDSIADYCAVNFYATNNHYEELCKTFDMNSFAGIANYGYVQSEFDKDPDGTYYQVSFVSEKMVNDLPPLDYKFSKTKPKGYREAYAPVKLKEDYKIGKIYDISVYEGVYQYKQKIKILGYCETEYYDFICGWTYTLLGHYDNNFLIYDDIPPLANIESGLMMDDKTPEYYNSLGVCAFTIGQMNTNYKTAEVNDIFLCWCICALVLFVLVVLANYYFAADKLVKRSGVMYIFGGKRSTIIAMEIVKLLLIFALAVCISAMTIGIVIEEKGSYVIVDWASYFICVAIILVIYAVSCSLGFVKLARFKPLKTISNSNTE